MVLRDLEVSLSLSLINMVSFLQSQLLCYLSQLLMHSATLPWSHLYLKDWSLPHSLTIMPSQSLYTHKFQIRNSFKNAIVSNNP